jgi:serine protease Do
MRRRPTWKFYLATVSIFLVIGLSLALKLEWVRPLRAEPAKTEPEWIFNGSTPRSFADLARRVQDAVVNISTTKNFKIRRETIYQYNDEYFQRYVQNQPGVELKRPNSLGSGFILNKEGYILTNNHVLQGADEIQAKLADGRSFQAQIIGVDPVTDLAVIKINASSDLPTVQLGDSDHIDIGDWVVAIGNPFGLTQTVTAGILSAKGRVIGAGPYDNFLQTDASINPGNSGGPLFNLNGEVVGVNTAIVQGGQGIGFAIPINQAKTVIPQLIHGGKVERGYLGIGLQEMTPELAKRLSLNEGQGILVGEVFQNSPADRAGLQPGDVILSFNGQDIKRAQDLPLLVSQSAIGSKAKVDFLRGGKKQSTEVHLVSLDEAGPEEPMSEVLGVAVQDISPLEAQKYGLRQGAGVKVTQVESNTPASSVGLQAGDLILELNNQAVFGSKAFLEQTRNLKRGEVVRLYVKRGPLASYFAFYL